MWWSGIRSLYFLYSVVQEHNHLRLIFFFRFAKPLYSGRLGQVLRFLLAVVSESQVWV